MAACRVSQRLKKMYRVFRERFETGRTGPCVFIQGVSAGLRCFMVVGQSVDDRNAALGCFCAGTPDKMAAEHSHSSVRRRCMPLVLPPKVTSNV